MQSTQSKDTNLAFVVTVTLIVTDIARSTAFYRDNTGGGGTDDKPDVTAAPLKDPKLLSSFLNLRVTDIRPFYVGQTTITGKPLDFYR